MKSYVCLSSVFVMSLASALTVSADSLNFDALPTGTIVSSVTSVGGVGPIGINGINPTFPGQNTAVIFDSAAPTGGDVDLGTPNQTFGGPGIGIGGQLGQPFANGAPLNKVLIVEENMVIGGGGLVVDPDDSAVLGSALEFDFSALGTVTLSTMRVVDLEQLNAPAFVQLYGPGNVLLSTINMPITGDNGVALVDLGPTAGVVRMVVTLNDSGAVDTIVFEEESGGGEGCTPGYWKQEHHFDSWVGFAPGDSFTTIFGVNEGSLTLLEALQRGGGGRFALGRHAVAALLNASSSVSFFYTTSQIIAMVQAAYATGTFGAAHTLLLAQNELGCPLN